MPPPAEHASILALEAMLTRIFDMSRSSRYVERLLGLARVQIHPSGWAIMGVLAREGSPSISSLAELLTLDQSTVSRQLKPLEAAGLIRRTVDASDRRSTRIALSDEGQAVIREVRRRQRQDLAWFIRRWSETDRLTLGRLATQFCVEIDEGQASLDAEQARQGPGDGG